jgi:hypothetical protein
MSIVIVCSITSLFDAISAYNYTLLTENENQRIAVVALTDFFQNSDEAKTMFTRNELFCFSLPTFLVQINHWIKREQDRCPKNTDRIVAVKKIIIQLFQSTWPRDNNLLVRELLTGDEQYQDYP